MNMFETQAPVRKISRAVAVEALLGLLADERAALQAQITAAAATVQGALARGENVIIRARNGIGIRTVLSDRLNAAGIAHATYLLAGLHPIDAIDGIPYPTPSGLAYSTPTFKVGFETETVLILDEVNAAHPRVAAFIHAQAARGRLVLIFRNDFNLDDFSDFPATRIDIGFAATTA